jgi:nitric oxide reductase subunit B
MMTLGLLGAALLFLPALLSYRNYTIATFYRWWTIHLWVEGVFELVQASMLAFLLIKLTGAGRTQMEKWLYIVVGLTFLTGLLGTAHHYFWIGVPGYWLPLGGFFSALEPLPFLAMALMAYAAFRQMKVPPPNRVALHWALGSALLAGIGAGLLGLAHTWPAVNQWTHGTLVTPMHGHLAFFGAYGMIIIAMISYSMPFLTGSPEAERKTGGVGLWAFWLMVTGITGMTMAFGAAGIGQVYLERILGIGYLDTQLMLHVHFQMLLFAAFVFATGVMLFLVDFFLLNPRRGYILAEYSVPKSGCARLRVWCLFRVASAARRAARSGVYSNASRRSSSRRRSTRRTST